MIVIKYMLSETGEFCINYWLHHDIDTQVWRSVLLVHLFPIPISTLEYGPLVIHVAGM